MVGLGENRTARTSPRTQAVEYDEGLRAYMLKVFNNMAAGLGVTGFVAYFTAASPAMMHAIFGTPLAWVVMFAPLGFVIYLSAKVHAMSESKAQKVFYIFATVMGLSMATIFAAYTQASIARTFFITASLFGSMSL